MRFMRTRLSTRLEYPARVTNGTVRTRDDGLTVRGTRGESVVGLYLFYNRTLEPSHALTDRPTLRSGQPDRRASPRGFTRTCRIGMKRRMRNRDIELPVAGPQAGERA